MSTRYAPVIAFLLFATAVIGFLFWQQEVQYAPPIPTQEDCQYTELHNSVSTALVDATHSQPIYPHFLNPVFPCSKFNSRHLTAAARAFDEQADFFVPFTINYAKFFAQNYGGHSTPDSNPYALIAFGREITTTNTTNHHLNTKTPIQIAYGNSRP